MSHGADEYPIQGRAYTTGRRARLGARTSWASRDELAHGAALPDDKACEGEACYDDPVCAACLEEDGLACGFCRNWSRDFEFEDE